MYSNKTLKLHKKVAQPVSELLQAPSRRRGDAAAVAKRGVAATAEATAAINQDTAATVEAAAVAGPATD